MTRVLESPGHHEFFGLVEPGAVLIDKLTYRGERSVTTTAMAHGDDSVIRISKDASATTAYLIFLGDLDEGCGLLVKSGDRTLAKQLHTMATRSFIPADATVCAVLAELEACCDTNRVDSERV